jgi:hypothetical protein
LAKYDPNAPETEEDGIRAEALRRLKVRRLSTEAKAQNPALLQVKGKRLDSLAKVSALQVESSGSSASALTPIQDFRPSSAQDFREKQMDLLAECISDLNSQLQEWLGFDIPAEGTEDYEIWQMKISLIEQVESISDVYELCEGGDFNLPTVLQDE